MKFYCLLFFLGMSLAGCVSDLDEMAASETDVVIYGNDTRVFNGEKMKSRGSSLIQEGDSLSLFAQKGIVAENQKLTLTGNSWFCHPPLKWSKEVLDAEITAYSPEFPKNAEDFYTQDGQLKDYLVCKGNFAYHTAIQLHFKHLFAQFLFEADPLLNKELKSITFIPSVKVKSIEPYQARLSLEPATEQQHIHLSHRKDASYSILVPSSDTLSLKIEIETHAGEVLTKDISAFRCESGQCYRATIKKKGSQIGIYNAEDFIAFSYLINNYPYEGHDLSQYGETKNGVTTYYLREDIHFSEKDRKRVQQIGDRLTSELKATKFSDVFDGQNHTLHNLWIEKEFTRESGLFQRISSKGIVKNLCIEGSTARAGKNVDINGLLCGNNEGRIENCHVINSTIITTKGPIGGIIGHNIGTLYNSSVQGLCIDTTNPRTEYLDFAGLCLNNTPTGKILNSYAVKITLKANKKLRNKYSALTYANEGTIENCFSDSCDNKIEALCWYNRSEHIEWCYYPKERYTNHLIGKGSTQQYLSEKHIKYFTHSKESKQATTDLLNKWIQTRGAELYADYQFLPWKLESDLTITFDSF